MFGGAVAYLNLAMSRFWLGTRICRGKFGWGWRGERFLRLYVARLGWGIFWSDLFRLGLTLFGKGMFFARTNGHHGSGAKNAHGLPNRNSHNGRHSNRPPASCARMKAEGSIIMFVEVLLILLIMLVIDCLSLD